MPGLGGLKAVEVLRKEAVNSRVIINTAYSEFEYARRSDCVRRFRLSGEAIGERNLPEGSRKSHEIPGERAFSGISGKFRLREYQKVVDMAGEKCSLL